MATKKSSILSSHHVKGSKSGDFTVIPLPKATYGEDPSKDASPMVSYGLTSGKSPMDNNSRNKPKGVGSSGISNKGTILTERTQK